MRISNLFTKTISCSIGMLLLFAPLTVLAQTKVVVIPLFGDDTKPLKNIITVAKANGNFTDPVAAVNSITNASATNPYLVVIGPGVYTISQTLVMKEYVDITGCGENVTKLTGAISTDKWDASSAIISGVTDAVLSSVTVENTGGGDNSIALYNSGSVAVCKVTAMASGGTTNNYGVYNKYSSPTMTGVTATALGGVNTMGVLNVSSSSTMLNVTALGSGGVSCNYGVNNQYPSSPKMRGVTATALGGKYNYGVYNSSSSPTMMDVTATASGGEHTYGVSNGYSSATMTNVIATASGGYSNKGVSNEYSSPTGIPLTMTNVTATASGGDSSVGVSNLSLSTMMTDVIATAADGTTRNYGVSNANISSSTMTNVTASASGGTTNYGIHNFSSSPAIRRSTMKGSTNSLFTGSGATATVSQSTLIGVAGGGGKNICVACDDGSGYPLDEDCLVPL